MLAVTSQQARRISPTLRPWPRRASHSSDMDSLIGIYGPRGMPSARARKHRRRRPRRDRGRSHHRDSGWRATGQVVDVRGPAEFAAGIKEIRDQLAEIAKALGIKPAQQRSKRRQSLQ